jgi:hypothetical protein
LISKEAWPMPDDPRDFATCYEILHSGEGPRGRSVDVMGRGRPGEWYAGQAAEYFDDVWLRSMDGDPEDLASLDGGINHIEVCYPGREPERFVVRCRIVRVYEATGEG